MENYQREERHEDYLFPKEEAERISREIYREMVESAKPTLDAIEACFRQDRFFRLSSKI